MTKKKKKMIILISAIAIVVTATIVLVVVLTTNKNHDNPKPGPSPTTPTTSVVPTTSEPTPSSGSSETNASSTSAQVYEITLNNGGYGELPTNKLYGNQIVPATLPRLKADGFIFRGWVLSSDPDNILVFNTDIESDVTLNAVWIPISSYEMLEAEAEGNNSVILVNPSDYAQMKRIDNMNPYEDIYQNGSNGVRVEDNKFIIDEGFMTINIDSNTDVIYIIFTVKPQSRGTIIDLYIDNDVALNVSLSDNLVCKIFEDKVDTLNDIDDSNLEYSFFIRIDVPNKLMDVAINNKEFYTGYKFRELENVQMLEIRPGEVSNIALKFNKKIANYIDYYCKLLDEYLLTFDMTLYDNNGEEITSAFEAGKTALESLSTVEAIEAKYEEIRTAMANVKTTEQKAYEKDYNDALTNFEALLNSHTYLMLEEMNDPNLGYVSKDDILNSFKDEYKTVTTRDELTALVTKYTTAADRYSDTNTILISEYILYKKDIIYTDYNRKDYKINNGDQYDAIKEELENSLNTLTLKADIDERFEVADSKFAALKTDKELLDEDKASAEGELHHFIEDEMAIAINNLKTQAEAGNQDAKTAYEKLLALLETCYTTLDNSRDKESLEKRLNDIKLEINDYLTYGLGQLTQYKENKVKMLEAYKNSILEVLSKDTALELYTNIENVQIENIDSLGTIEEVKTAYDAAIAKVNNYAYTDDKTNAVVTIIAYSESKKEESLYYQYYGSLKNFETRIEDIINLSRVEIVKANNSTEIGETIDKYKGIIDEEITKIREETEFTVTFIVKDAEGNLLPSYAEFKIPSPTKKVLDQAYGEFDYYDQFDKESGIPTVVISGVKYRCAGAYSKFNSQSDRADYDFNSEIKSDQTIYIVWDIIG